MKGDIAGLTVTPSSSGVRIIQILLWRLSDDLALSRPFFCEFMQSTAYSPYPHTPAPATHPNPNPALHFDRSGREVGLHLVQNLTIFNGRPHQGYQNVGL